VSTAPLNPRASGEDHKAAGALSNHYQRIKISIAGRSESKLHCHEIRARDGRLLVNEQW
jgi:hypothetical protein